MSSETEEEMVAAEEKGVEREGDGGDRGLEWGEEVTLVESERRASVEPGIEQEGEVARWKDLALRSQAELDNFRKRVARERMDMLRYCNAPLLESLLPVVDNFQLGLEAARQDAGQSIVFQGMSMVCKQLTDLLQESGLQEVPAEGLPFDPNLHEAVKEEPSDAVPEGHVIAVIRKGFRLHDRLIRAASVIVSRGVPSASGDGTGVEHSGEGVREHGEGLNRKG